MRSSSPLRFVLRLIGGILVIVAVSLGIFYYVMQPPMSDLGHMAQFLSITALLSGLAGYAAYRFRWMERSPALRWSLLGGYALASLLTFLNVWLTARLMFASQHDLLLATILLVFAGGIAMVLGYFLSNTVTERIRHLDQAAKEIQAGNLSVRIPVSGNDEIAGLARTFNQMAARLQEADANQRALESLRRDLVAWAGHDLRTPLTGVRVLVEALADGILEDDPDTSRRYLQQARKQIDHLSLLIDDLFQVSQLDAGGIPLNLEPASLSDLISDTLEDFSGIAAKEGVTLTGSAAPGIDPVRMDVQRIGRVLNNLVSNALRHTPSGGTVSLQAEPLGETARVFVQDSGEGVSPADLAHVFDRFYRGEKSRNQATGGSGLGLAIAKGIIEAHGGQINVESNPGQGAKFIFTLPKKD
ncbi:MAG: HAMP domain-containing sensor histidine kinase [Chloroflexota bacterium]